MTYDEILEYPWEFDDVEASNIREYLEALILHLWEEGEGFSGKRPFGNSGWQYDLMAPLVAMGEIKGEIDADGYIDDIDSDAGYDAIYNLIIYIFSKK